MNEKIENLIKQEQERLDAEKKQIREEHLISLGLVDQTKTERKYLNGFDKSALWDETRRLYYIEKAIPLDITDEEYIEVCKYFPPNSTPNEATTAEKALNVIATIVLILGIIGTVICSFSIVFVDSGRYTYSEDIVFNPIGFVTTLGVLLISLTIWSILRIFSEIATNVRQSNNKIK